GAMACRRRSRRYPRCATRASLPMPAARMAVVRSTRETLDAGGVDGGGAVAVARVRPLRAGVGATVILDGDGFDPSARANVVQFGSGSAALAETASAHELTVIVPVGAQSGLLTVSNSRGVAVSTSSVTVVKPPSVASLAPVRIFGGGTITIRGTGFVEAF